MDTNKVGAGTNRDRVGGGGVGNIPRKFTIKIKQTDGVGQWQWQVEVYLHRRCIFQLSDMRLDTCMAPATAYILEYYQDAANG